MKNNFIIHQHARRYQWSGECFLSLKSFYRGSAKYRVQQREYDVDEKNYLILNDCTRYDLNIESKTDTESFCVFFSPDFVSYVVSELSATDEKLLDFSVEKIGGINLIEKKYPHLGPVSKILQEGKAESRDCGSELGKEEFYYRLLTAICLQNDRSLREAEQLIFKKKATREEIYRRINYAHDFIESNYTQDLSLKEIAKVAMLSENHLLRNFRQIFKISPFQYIVKLKIAAAKRRLRETDAPISEIAALSGYSSLSNFSCYFKSITGDSPSDYRKMVTYRK